ncbi:hypothetical protein DKG77_03175 [Flagellimonas aquimarina]|uniref:Polysaccharide biosynthesis protein C-terminal domain-containing protein n=1 Tax=Flagellimonas aquimarina TaxID=2201895 RepID=A0A316L4K6_9FLAO|nr:oligosaccharide flippase family protein [Allomuricauda koreensis]PWL39845.1 hypothetical protein DKG77_03175 [Allomuricauda koreensis]
MSRGSLLKNSAIYSVIMLLQKGINFFLIPVLTIYLTPYDYGVVAVVMAVNTFLNVFYLLALNGSLNRFFYEFKGNDELVKKLFGTIVTFVLFNSLLISLILFIGRKWLLQPFLADIEFFPYMLLGLVSVMFNPCYTIYQNSLQAKQEGIRYGKNNMGFFILNISLLLLSVIVFDMGAKGVLGSLAVTNIIFFIYSLFGFRREFTFGIDWDLLLKSIKYAFPLIPHTIAGVATALIDRILINKLLTTSLVGIYSIGNNFGAIVFLIASGINQAFVPWFNQKIKENKKTEIPKIAKSLILFYCVIALSLSFFGKEVIMLITPQIYHSAWRVIPFIAFAFVYHGVYYFFVGALFYDIKGRGNRIIPVATISAALTNIALNIALIPIYGILGAAIATFISKFLLSISLSFLYGRYVKITYPVKYMLFMPLGFFVISLIGFITVFDRYLFLTKTLIFALVLFLYFLFLKSDIRKFLKEVKLFN